MSTNCLVTKLKVVIDNDNLLKIGDMRLKFVNEYQAQFINRQVGSQQWPITIVPIEGNVYVAYNSATKPANPITEPVTITHNTDSTYGVVYTVWFAAGSEVLIENYYDIAYGIVNAENFQYLNQENGMKKLWVLSGNLSDININKTYPVDVMFLDIKADGSDILDFYRCLTSIARLEVINMRNISYTMKQLGNALSTSISTYYGPNNNNPKYDITGTMEDFVAMQKIKGRSNGSVNMGNAYYPEVTFNDNSIRWGSGSIVWSTESDNTTITYKNITTVINIQSDGTWTRVS